ncbi:hypothetical protein AMAG_14917 [Allomyces macrogynus ATCC 38327]|uniref:Uncharacterized protein n=1 Tax=Allomyces macrogynus (strain ATCC 38327) TaxID=578462 RepID=A0A0L0T8A1_ALLM3|nr:hypothetical protein AMAG_14917 [Allomyces macrogynus ATCC 38327]|eukprot:KNE70799.1 hypothetical protein AMAG_14917 [Allomyces macrogynus ATCC 38327]
MAKLLKPATAAAYFPGCDLDDVLPTLVPGPAFGGKAVESDDLGKFDLSDSSSGDGTTVTDAMGDDLERLLAKHAAEDAGLYQFLYEKKAALGPDACAATTDASSADWGRGRVKDPKYNSAPVDPKPAEFAQKQKTYLNYTVPGFDASVPFRTGLGQPVMPRMMAPPTAGPYGFPRASAAGMPGYAPPTIPGNPIYYEPPTIPGNPVYYTPPAPFGHPVHTAPLCAGPPAGGHFGYPALGAAPNMPTGIVPPPPRVMLAPEAVYGTDPTMLELMADLAQDVAVQHMMEAVLLDKAAALAKASQRAARMASFYSNCARFGPMSRFMV